MDVFKFGGASINNIDRIKNTGNIIKTAGRKILVVISAMGKTTNALEKVVEAYYGGNTDEALRLFESIKKSHHDILTSLTHQELPAAQKHIQDHFTEIEWMLHDKPVRNFDYYYDQIVCVGELLSSSIISHYLNEEKVSNKWLDVRDIIRTDDTFRDATVDWDFTEKNIHNNILPLFQHHDIIITQGYIGATDENESTTLGREGSDYTAAIFANLLNADSVIIWKDVEGVMNADPKAFTDVVNIEALSYTEVIEMAYYGAQVIHPKTIKPLQNKNIPLYVKSFLDPSLKGTVINNTSSNTIPPVIVLKENQVLVNFRSKDFSFIEDKPAVVLKKMFETIKVKSNISQHTAISLLCCFDDHPEKISLLAAEAAHVFDVEVQKGLTLLTIRHYNEAILQSLTLGKEIILEQRTPETVQLVFR